MIEKALSFAREDGAVFVQLETQLDNEIAQRLYKKLVFSKQDADNESVALGKILNNLIN